MSQFIMLLFCLYLVAYGYMALFKKEWIWKVRNFSARLEGKGKVKPDERAQSVNKMGNILGALALILGIIGVVMNIALLVTLSRGGAV